MNEGHGHVPVLATEALEHLALRAGDRACDLTLGAGGHSELILEAVGEEGEVVAFDRDPKAIAIARERLERFGERLQLVESDFKNAPRRLDDLGWIRLDGVLMDLGVSSMQLDEAERGFSFQEDGPLDMRMSPRTKTTAAEIVATADKEELERILRDYGEEPRARAIAEKIVELRKRTRIKRTSELAELVRVVCGPKGRIHPATRTFQALRIAVNGELEALEGVLRPLIERLADGRRLVAISFHSLEDRIVKQGLRAAQKEGLGRVMTKRPIMPGDEEISRNPRSRSSRMRVFERSEGENR